LGRYTSTVSQIFQRRFLNITNTESSRYVLEETMKIRGKHKTREVFIDGVLLDPADSQKIYIHSPDGFSWGSRGSGCTQLALALILRFAGSAGIAKRLYHDFKFEIIQHIPIDSDFEMDAELITDWIAERRLKLEQAEKI